MSVERLRREELRIPPVASIRSGTMDLAGLARPRRTTTESRRQAPRARWGSEQSIERCVVRAIVGSSSLTLEPAMATVDVNTATLYFERRGDGPPLLLVPGAAGDAGIWDTVADALADEFTVVTYDRRGNSMNWC